MTTMYITYHLQNDNIRVSYWPFEILMIYLLISILYNTVKNTYEVDYDINIFIINTI